MGKYPLLTPQVYLNKNIDTWNYKYFSIISSSNGLLIINDMEIDGINEFELSKR
jgi:hypothetical protein